MIIIIIIKTQTHTFTYMCIMHTVDKNLDNKQNLIDFNKKKTN